MSEPGSRLEFQVGAVYGDCVFHPVLCTYVSQEDDQIQGISLVDGSEPRTCSLSACDPEALSDPQAVWIMRNFDDYVSARKSRRAPAEITGSDPDGAHPPRSSPRGRVARSGPSGQPGTS